MGKFQDGINKIIDKAKKLNDFFSSEDVPDIQEHRFEGELATAYQIQERLEKSQENLMHHEDKKENLKINESDNVRIEAINTNKKVSVNEINNSNIQKIEDNSDRGI